MSVLTQFPKGNEERLKRLESVEKQIATDILRLWKRIPAGPDDYGANLISAYPVDPEEVFEESGIQHLTGTLPVSGGTGPEGSGSLTRFNTGRSGGGSGPGLTGGTPDLSGGTLQTGGTLTGGTVQTGATAGTGLTGGHYTGGTFTGQGTGGTNIVGSGTPNSGINTGRSGGGSGPGLTGGTGLSGTPESGTPLSGTPYSGVCVGPLLIDELKDTAGLQLALHTIDYDLLLGGWLGDTSEILMTVSGEATPKDAAAATGTHEYRAYVNEGQKNYYLKATGVTGGSANGGTARYVGFIVRYVSDLDHWILRIDVANNALQIIEVNAGSRTTRASAGIPSAAATGNGTLTALVRDKYIRLEWTVSGTTYPVSYGAASYLESAGRFGMYFAHTGTVNSNQKIGRITADCLPHDTSGTGISGSRSRNTQGTTNTGGTIVGGTGGTPVTGGTQPSGTGTGTTWEDPNSDVSYTWSDAAGSNYTRVDDAKRPPGQNPTTGSDYCHADPNDDNEEAVFGMTQRLTVGSISKLTIWSHMVTGSANLVGVELRLKLNGSWQTAGSVTVTTSSAWYSKVYTGSWTPATVYPLQSGVKTPAMGKSDDLYVHEITVQVDYT